MSQSYAKSSTQSESKPSPQSPGRQGDAKDGAAFGAESAVDYQPDYGNEAVQGMAEEAQTDQGEQGGDAFDRGLAALDGGTAERVSRAVLCSGTGESSASSWVSAVPASQLDAVQSMLGGMVGLEGYLIGAVEEVGRALEREDEVAEEEATISVMDLLSRLEVAVELLDAHQQLYQADLAGLMVGMAETLTMIGAAAGVQLMANRAARAAAEVEAAKAELLEAVSDVLEAQLQAAIQLVLAELESAVIVDALLMCGPAGPLMAFAAHVGFTQLNSAVDEGLGREPGGVAAEITAVEGEVSGALGFLASGTNTLEELPQGQLLMDVNKVVGPALILIDSAQEQEAAASAAGAALKHMMEAGEELDQVLDEVRTFNNESLPELIGMLQYLQPDLLVAEALATSACGSIVELEGRYGSGLYGPA